MSVNFFFFFFFFFMTTGKKNIVIYKYIFPCQKSSLSLYIRNFQGHKTDLNVFSVTDETDGMNLKLRTKERGRRKKKEEGGGGGGGGGG